MEAALGREDLDDELERLEDRDEILHIDLSGRDPDDGATRLPYEKGALFLRLLEAALRARALRRVPALLLRSFRLPEHHDGGFVALPAGKPARDGRRAGGAGAARALARGAGSSAGCPPPRLGSPADRRGDGRGVERRAGSDFRRPLRGLDDPGAAGVFARPADAVAPRPHGGAGRGVRPDRRPGTTRSRSSGS